MLQGPDQSLAHDTSKSSAWGGMLDDILLSRSVSSRAELIQRIRQCLGDAIERETDTHNTTSIIFIFKYQDRKYLLKAEFGSDTATHREITWYERLGSRDPEIAPRYFGSHSSDSHALLLIGFIDGAATIDEIAHAGASVDQAVIRDCVVAALDADRRMFAATSRSATSQEVARFFERKYEARRKEAQQIPFLRRLLEVPQIVLNGDTLYAPDKALDKIKGDRSLYRHLTPNRVGFIHGDLHCGNILLKERDVFFIDPNGQPEMPFEYDVGKILHSIHGDYGSIMLGKYELEMDDSSRYSFSTYQPDSYEAALEKLRGSMTDQEYVRGLYAEAMHFATMLPHHAQNQRETLALYLRCVQLFNELLTLAA